MNKITTTKEGVITFHINGEVAGCIYNDQKTRTKRMFWLREMSVEEIAELVSGGLSTFNESQAIDGDKREE